MSSASTTPTSADQLETLIQRHVLCRVKLCSFRVLVQERGLVLQGCAPTYYAKQIAQHVAMEVSGLPIQANEIEVR